MLIYNDETVTFLGIGGTGQDPYEYTHNKNHTISM